jgi:hypothetical protein
MHILFYFGGGKQITLVKIMFILNLSDITSKFRMVAMFLILELEKKNLYTVHGYDYGL